MNVKLHDYDIYPKVVCTGSTVGITIQPLGLHAQFPDTVKLCISPLQERTYPLDDAQRSICNYDLKPDDNGCLCFDHSFASEQEYILRFYKPQGDRIVGCLFMLWRTTLAGLIPLMGDLHLHSIRSDASQDPAVIAAYMRKMGYDFIAITDHKNFSGSLECIDAYRDAPIEMCLMTGEEVHLPDCHLHCVHVGGQYSINAMVDTVFAELEKKLILALLHAFPICVQKWRVPLFPGTMTEAEFRSTIEDYADTLDPIPQGIPRYVYAGFCWICERIRAADGLSIFTHPYWIHDTSSNGLAFHADERFNAVSV
ncbi:MAG: PHP domain-containing protein [Christensenellales bacterium]